MLNGTGQVVVTYNNGLKLMQVDGAASAPVPVASTNECMLESLCMQEDNKDWCDRRSQYIDATTISPNCQ